MALSSLALAAGAEDAQVAPRALESRYAGWRLAAGDVHRHAGTAYSVLTLSRAHDDRRKCPHEYGPATALYSAAREAGYDWLNLSYHAGVGHIVKPDGTPHKLVGSPSDPAYRWWTQPGRKPITHKRFSDAITPNPRGFPDFVTGGIVEPAYNEALSLASAANAHTVEGEFVAFSGREFTTANLVPVGGRAAEGGHKVAIFPGDTTTSCGVSTDAGAASECRHELDLYRWAVAEDAILIQAHPGGAPKLPKFHRKSARGGFSDRFVQGIEVGRAKRFEPSWEKAYQQALQSGYRLFPAYGSDLHHYGGQKPCADGAPNRSSQGATVCWVDELSRQGITAAMRERRCYYSRARKPELRFSLVAENGQEIAQLGTELERPEGVIRAHVSAVNDLGNQRDGENPHRFNRLELVYVSRIGAEVVAACGSSVRDECYCRRGDRDRPDRCEFRGAVDLPPISGALYPRLREVEQKVPCNSSERVEDARCLGEPSMIVGAPIVLN